MAKLNINGKVRDVQAEPDTPLLWVIREQVGLTGTKYGCGEGQCGACTVLLDGVPIRSCQTPCGTVGPQKITTIEGLEKNGQLHPPRLNPLLGSSSAPPGPCMTPSSDR